MPDHTREINQSGDAPRQEFERDWPAYIAEVRARHHQGDTGADRYDDVLILAAEVERLRSVLNTSTWQFNEAVSMLRSAALYVTFPSELWTEINDALPAIQAALEAAARG